MINRFAFCVVMVLCLVSIGCGNTSHPGVWKQPEIEAYMLKTEQPKMTEVTISPDPAGGYTGTGKAPDGETFKLTIKQDAERKRLSWSANGDRGTVIPEASYEFVSP